jgi:hypothetical protein
MIAEETYRLILQEKSNLEDEVIKLSDVIDSINERLKQNFTDAELRVRIRLILEIYYADQE